MIDRKLNIKLLTEEISMLEKAMQTLKLSVDKCTTIYKKNDYSFEDLESFDSLTSKFSRASDIFTQKVIRTIWILLHEPFIPFIDMLNQAEKMNIIFSADQLLEIRDLRNQITHEYLPEAITELIPEVLENFIFLEKNINKTNQFINKRKWV
jgi:hypothetical protein